MSIQEISARLSASGVDHVVVASVRFENDLAKAFHKNKEREGDTEIDLSDDDHLRATYTAFAFKPQKFIPFLVKNGVSESEIQDFMEKNKKDIPKGLDINSDVVGVILVEPNDDAVFITLNTRDGMRAKLAVLQEREELLEGEGDDEDYDPETDEIETDDED